MLLSPDHEQIRDAVRAFVAAEVAPHAAAWDRDASFPRAALQGLAALGLFGVFVPEHLGGAGLDYTALALALEEVAAGDGATSTILSVNNCPVCNILLNFGSAAQKEQWLKPLASGALLGAFALTEAHAGSDASALKTTARRAGDHYVIDGAKQFITSGKNGDLAIVFAVTDKGAGKKGISASVRAKAPSSAPLARGFSHCSLCAALPKLSRMLHTGQLLTERMVEVAPSPAATSSSASASAV